MIKKNRVTFDSVYEKAFKVHIGDKIIKFPDNYDGNYLSKLERNIFRKVAEEKKINMIEGLNGLQTMGKTRRVLANAIPREHYRQEIFTIW